MVRQTGFNEFSGGCRLDHMDFITTDEFDASEVPLERYSTKKNGALLSGIFIHVKTDINTLLDCPSGHARVGSFEIMRERCPHKGVQETAEFAFEHTTDNALILRISEHINGHKTCGHLTIRESTRDSVVYVYNEIDELMFTLDGDMIAEVPDVVFKTPATIQYLRSDHNGLIIETIQLMEQLLQALAHGQVPVMPERLSVEGFKPESLKDSLDILGVDMDAHRLLRTRETKCRMVLLFNRTHT